MTSAPPLPSLVVAPEVDLKPWSDTVFGDASIGRWRPKAARAGAFEAVVPLSDAEQDRCTSPVDVAFAFLSTGRLERGRLREALGQALACFPPVAGRFVRREVQLEGFPEKAIRLCILCNNAGVAFRATSVDCKLPPTVGLLAPKLFDRALGTEPSQAGGLGGPLFRVQLMDFEDGGQLLALSFVRGLADVVGLGHFVQRWAGLYRGEEAGTFPLPDLDRVELELSLAWQQSRLQTSFVRIHHPEPVDPGMAVKGELVASVLFRSEELQSMVQSISEQCRKKFLIYDSETLSEAEVVLATVAEAMRGSLEACMPLDRRELYGVERLFGQARAFIDLKLPPDLFNTAAALRKLPKIAESRDFWSWKCAQPQHTLEGRLVLDSWLQGLELGEMRFGEAVPVGANLSSAYWQESVADPTGCGSCQALLLPHAEGVLLQALLPRQAVTRLSTGRIFSTWQP